MSDLIEIDKGLDYIDKLIACIVGDKEATPEQLAQIQKLDLAWSLLQRYASRRTACRMLQGKLEIKPGYAYKLIRDAIQIYGNTSEIEKAGIKAIHAENLMRLARKAEAKGGKFLKVAGDLYIKAAQIEGAFDKDMDVVQNADQWLAPPTVEFSNDRQVFIDSQRIQDVTHQVVNEEEDLSQ